MPKLTFSLDEESVQMLRRVAARSRKPQSLIVREAIAQYAERVIVLRDGRLDTDTRNTKAAA